MKTVLLKALKPYRFVELRYHGPKYLKKPGHKKNWDGEETNKYIHQIRQDGDCLWLFLANARKLENDDLILEDRLLMKLAGPAVLWRQSML